MSQMTLELRQRLEREAADFAVAIAEQERIIANARAVRADLLRHHLEIAGAVKRLNTAAPALTVVASKPAA